MTRKSMIIISWCYQKAIDTLIEDTKNLTIAVSSKP
jgi:hypothetical protein